MDTEGVLDIVRQFYMIYTGRPFVITGCGRSGTKYISRVLTAAGVQCGHEKIFTGRTDDQPHLLKVQGDASWLAVPFLSKLPPDALILHQTRDPIRVVLSYVAEGFFRQVAHESPLWKHLVKRLMGRPASGQYRLIQLVRATLPEVFAEDTELKRAARFWINWNDLVQKTATEMNLLYFRYRIEDVDEPFINALFSRLGISQPGDLTGALAEVPRNLNTRPRGSTFEIDDLSGCKEAFIASAAGYGYSLPSSGTIRS